MVNIFRWNIFYLGVIMNFNEYQKRAVSTNMKGVDEENNLPSIARLTLGLAGESGEVAEKVKKILRGDYKNSFYVDPNKISPVIANSVGKELGDVLWYLAVLAREFGFDLDDIATQNLRKLAKRYTEGKLQGEGDNR